MTVLGDIRAVIQAEVNELESLLGRVDDSFEQAVDLLCSASGKVILSGLGKSGAIAKKIAATLTSTGTSAVYVHPVEGAHGDFGIVQKGDVAILISKSGGGDELQTLIPFLSSQSVPVIAITGEPDSVLGRSSSVVLNGGVSQEACPHNLAPTSSTTLALVIGDALAVAVLKKKEFSSEDFARFHPAGALGKRLLLRVGDVLRAETELPLVKADTPLKDVIGEISQKRFGAALVVDDQGSLKFVITDGDLRRLIEQVTTIDNHTASDFAPHPPRTIGESALAAVALKIMKEHKIQMLVVVNENNVPQGIVHIHDILQAGVL